MSLQVGLLYFCSLLLYLLVGLLFFYSLLLYLLALHYLIAFAFCCHSLLGMWLA